MGNVITKVFCCKKNKTKITKDNDSKITIKIDDESITASQKIPNNKSLDKFYLTGTLQCLFYTNNLTKYFRMKYKEDKIKIISTQYYNIIKNLWNENEPFSPQNFKKYTHNFYNSLKGKNIKNDSKELIEFLFENIHKELNIGIINKNISDEIIDGSDKKKVFELFLNNFRNSHNSIISNLFYGIYEMKYECNSCNSTIYNYELFHFVELNVEKKSPLRITKENKINNIMETVDINLPEFFDFNKKNHYIIEEKKTKCDCTSKINKYLKILFSMPNYLIVFLKRDKNHKYNIMFPEKLDLTNYLIHNEYAKIFNLYGVIPLHNHDHNMNYFISYCKHPNTNKWYKYNENEVIECQNNEYLQIDPYVLFYERKRK